MRRTLAILTIVMYVPFTLLAAAAGVLAHANGRAEQLGGGA